MAHFAELGNDGLVLSVLVVSNEIIRGSDNFDDESLGVRYLHSLVSENQWVQTSYNNNFRRRYAGIGMTYSAEHDAFLLPQPFPSWTLDLNHPNDWVAPVPMPTDEGYWYEWDEQGQQWIPHEIEQPTP
jgi:hypothetical protein